MVRLCVAHIFAEMLQQSLNNLLEELFLIIFIDINPMVLHGAFKICEFNS